MACMPYDWNMRGKRHGVGRASRSDWGSLYTLALDIAETAHAGQIRRGSGEAYINHPLRVAAHATGPAKVAAVLHDVIEDTGVTREELEGKGIPVLVLDVLDLLTRRENETYRDFIERIATAPGEAGRIARDIKLDDIDDNLKGIELLPPDEQSIEKRYLRAQKRLKAAQDGT